MSDDSLTSTEDSYEPTPYLDIMEAVVDAMDAVGRKFYDDADEDELFERLRDLIDEFYTPEPLN